MWVHFLRITITSWALMYYLEWKTCSMFQFEVKIILLSADPELANILCSSGIHPWSWGLRGVFLNTRTAKNGLEKDVLAKSPWDNSLAGLQGQRTQLSEFVTFCLAVIVQLWMSSSFHQWQDHTSLMLDCICWTFILLSYIAHSTDLVLFLYVC